MRKIRSTPSSRHYSLYDGVEKQSAIYIYAFVLGFGILYVLESFSASPTLPTATAAAVPFYSMAMILPVIYNVAPVIYFEFQSSHA